MSVTEVIGQQEIRVTTISIWRKVGPMSWGNVRIQAPIFARN